MHTAILLFQCPDTFGIVARISNILCESKCNIIRSDQYSTDPVKGRFFIRLEFCYDEKNVLLEQLKIKFSDLAKIFQANYQLFDSSQRMRVSILVSSHDHCLIDLLYHWQCGELPAEISCVISNHKTCEALVKNQGIPFHYLPVHENTKEQQEKKILDIVKGTSDFLVLARYMQILSKDFLDRYAKPIINIHHSFLPSFVGAVPYQQAYDRGVKIIGATAHYVTVDLDEGPIIEQMVERVSHRDSVQTLKRKGRNLEKLALTKAVEAHLEHRVIQYKNKTIVFD